eukprot:8723444-Karenia_brevis.AAC.1
MKQELLQKVAEVGKEAVIADMVPTAMSKEKSKQRQKELRKAKAERRKALESLGKAKKAGFLEKMRRKFKTVSQKKTKPSLKRKPSFARKHEAKRQRLSLTRKLGFALNS